MTNFMYYITQSFNRIHKFSLIISVQKRINPHIDAKTQEREYRF